jgi:hypothetical protein
MCWGEVYENTGIRVRALLLIYEKIRVKNVDS